MNDTKPTKGCPLKTAFTTTSETFLQHSRNLLVGIITYFRGQTDEVVSQKHEKTLSFPNNGVFLKKSLDHLLTFGYHCYMSIIHYFEYLISTHVHVRFIHFHCPIRPARAHCTLRKRTLSSLSRTNS